MRFVFTVFLLFLPLNLCAASTGRDFQIGEYRAVGLVGEARILRDVHYVSFTGDFGFAGRLPSKDFIERHLARESALLANFQLRVINLELMLPGSSKRAMDRQIDNVTIDIIKRSGYDLVSRANNHAMDYGHEGVQYNTRLLQEAGLEMIGRRKFPVYHWKAGGRRIAIFSVTDYTDQADPDGLILKMNEADLELIKKESSGADFRIAFVHLGSMSSYPSPHERMQVKRLLDTGVGLVVCTGSHFVKGFVYEDGNPVVYGIGNHIFSHADKYTEPIGMHFVAGFNERDLVQLFVVPFHNTIMQGTSGPLDEVAFASFKNTLAERSTSDSSRYYYDPRNLSSLRERLGQLSFSKLKGLRVRHFVYATGILFYNYPIILVSTGGFVLVGAVIVIRATVLRRIKRQA